MVQIGQRDQPCLAQAGNVAADRFDREPKIIRNIGAGHRQIDKRAFIRTLPVRELQDKTRDTLACSLAAQQQHLLLGRCKLGRSAPEQRLLERREICSSRPRKAGREKRQTRTGVTASAL
jgi:hypothetical protein